MKKITSILLVTAFFVVTTFTSCEKSRVLNRLEGKWEVTSYIYDGNQFMGTLLESFTMDYNEAEDDEGDVTWTTVDNLVGNTSTDEGVYVINDDADELQITFTDGSDVTIVTAKIDDIDSDLLQLEGFDEDGEPFSITARQN